MNQIFCNNYHGSQSLGASDPLRLLLVEDSQEDAQLLVRALSDGGFRVSAERVETAAAMKVALQTQVWDLIISDYALPQLKGTEALALYQDSEAGAPFIIVSGVLGEDRAVEMVKAGAHNYVMKDNLKDLVLAVRVELQAAEERRLRKRSEDTASFMASLVESCEDAILGTDLNGKVLSWNSGAERLLGYAAREVVGRAISFLVPPYRPEEVPGLVGHIGHGERVDPYDTVWLRKGGALVEVSLATSPIKDGCGRVIGASVVARDITRQREEENERLALIQELTAALAHDSNIGFVPCAVTIPIQLRSPSCSR